MRSRCEQEMCPHWAGDGGCPCAVLGIDASEAPWDREDGCFGHCDPEGWFAPCRAPEPHDSGPTL